MNVMKGKHSRGLSILLSLVLALTMLLPTGFAQTAKAEETSSLHVKLYQNDSLDYGQSSDIDSPYLISVAGGTFSSFSVVCTDENGEVVKVNSAEADDVELLNVSHNNNIITVAPGSACWNKYGITAVVSVSTEKGNASFSIRNVPPIKKPSGLSNTYTNPHQPYFYKQIAYFQGPSVESQYDSWAEYFSEEGRVVWKSSDESILPSNDIKTSIEKVNGLWRVVASGTFLKEGKVTVTATVPESGVSLISSNLTVKAPIIVTPINSAINRIQPGDGVEIRFVDAEYGTTTWQSSDENVATVSSGVLTGHNPGSVTITATANLNNGETISATKDVVVLKKGLYKGKYTDSSSTHVEKIELDAQVSPTVDISGFTTEADGSQYWWYSDNTDVIKLNPELNSKKNTTTATAVANGVATVYLVRAGANYEGPVLVGSCEVTVTGCEKDAPEISYEPINDYQTALQGDASIELVSHTGATTPIVANNPANQWMFENYVGGLLPCKGAEFIFEIRSGGKVNGGASVPEEVESAEEYLARLQQCVSLVNDQNQIIAVPGDGLMLSVSTEIDTNPLAKVTILVDRNLDSEQNYRIVWSGDTPEPSFVKNASEDPRKLDKLASYQFVTDKRNVTDAIIDEIPDQTYTGKAITPSLTVKDGDKTLKEGTDYEVTYKNNTAVGTAIATIKGMGDYEGTQEVTFKIVEKKGSSDNNNNDSKDNNPNDTDKDKDNSTNKVTVGKTKMGTTGFYKAKAIKVKVKKKAKNATIYKYSIRKASAAKWTNKWSKKKTYKFKKLKNKELYQLKVAGYSKKNGVKGDDSKISYRYMSAVAKKAKGGKKKVTVTWKKDSKASGYEIRYATSKKALKNAKIIKVSKGKTKKVIKNLKKGKKYYVQVRPYKNYKGHKYNGIWWTKSAKAK